MSNNIILRKVFSNPSYFLAFGFGVGLLPQMPGTWGTLIAIPFYLLVQYVPWELYLAFVMTTFVIGIWLCDVAEKMVGTPDYPGIVWDEMVGYWITMFLAPHEWRWVIMGFVLFRVFDIFKPWPISWLNKNVAGGFGVMLDDFVAALFAFLSLQLLVWLITYL